MVVRSIRWRVWTPGHTIALPPGGGSTLYERSKCFDSSWQDFELNLFLFPHWVTHLIFDGDLLFPLKSESIAVCTYLLYQPRHWGYFLAELCYQISIYFKPVRRLGVFPWNIPEMTRASFGPQVTIPRSKHMFNLKLSLTLDLKVFCCVWFFANTVLHLWGLA